MIGGGISRGPIPNDAKPRGPGFRWPGRWPRWPGRSIGGSRFVWRSSCSVSTIRRRDAAGSTSKVPAWWAIEEHFHDVKEVWGAGQQQVRNVWSNVGCWHLNQWLFTLVELCSRDRSATELTDRRNRPWDNANRRSSHADRRRHFAREMLRNEFPATPLSTPETEQYAALFETLLNLCT